MSRLIIREVDGLFTDTLDLDWDDKGEVEVVGTHKKGNGAPARNYFVEKGKLYGTVSAPRVVAVKAEGKIKAVKEQWHNCERWTEKAGKHHDLTGIEMIDRKTELLTSGQIEKLAGKRKKPAAKKAA